MGVSVPAANASCFSIFGIGNGNGCTSSGLSVAIGIGANAVANASGFLGAAYSIGSAAEAYASGPTLAFAVGPATVSRIRRELDGRTAAWSDKTLGRVEDELSRLKR